MHYRLCLVLVSGSIAMALAPRASAQGFAAQSVRVGEEAPTTPGELSGGIDSATVKELAKTSSFTRDQIDYLTRRRLSHALSDPSLNSLLTLWVRLLSDLHESRAILGNHVVWLVGQLQHREKGQHLPKVDAISAVFDTLQQQQLGLVNSKIPLHQHHPALFPHRQRNLCSAPASIVCVK
jgi:hypothetical protein